MSTSFTWSNESIINANLEEYGLNLNNVEIIDPKSEDQKELRKFFSKKYWELRNRFGITMNESKEECVIEISSVHLC